jgi:ABC-2 type transport system permease protein
MTGTIFMETLRRNWRAMLLWGVGIGLLGWLQIIILPDVDSLQQMAELMESLPPAMVQMFGGGDASFMATPEGYLSLRFFSFMPVVFSIYAVMAGLGVTSNEEDQGIMDMLLSLPVSRWRVLLERFLAYSLLLCGILALSIVGLWIGTQMSPMFQVSVSTLLGATFSILPVLLVVLAFTIISATVLRRRGQAIALAFIFVIGGYFLDTLGQAATGSILYDLRAISVYRYYDGTQAITGGVVWSDIGLLLVVTVVLISGAVWFFQRRDIGG